MSKDNYVQVTKFFLYEIDVWPMKGNAYDYCQTSGQFGRTCGTTDCSFYVISLSDKVLPP